MEAIRSSETSVLIRATRRHLPEDDNHHSHRRGNLKSYKYWYVLREIKGALRPPNSIILLREKRLILFVLHVNWRLNLIKQTKIKFIRKLSV
jgi:hypothetical protein